GNLQALEGDPPRQDRRSFGARVRLISARARKCCESSMKGPRLDLYVRPYGGRDGVAARVRQNLLDLLPITEGAVALPLPSHSLKVVEQYVGFERQQEEFGRPVGDCEVHRGRRDGGRGDTGRGNGPDSRLQS